MEALYGQDGEVGAWLNDDGHIYSLNGENLAFIDQDSVYDWNGSHIGWWQDGHIRDSEGAVAYFTGDAKNLGIFRPFLAFKPFQPFKEFSPFKPFLDFKPFRPFNVSGMVEYFSLLKCA